MPPTTITSFLNNEIFENGQVVTFRSLSRQKLLHVNDAKNKLAEFYSEACTLSRPVYAVFQVTGEVATSRASPSNGLEGDENAMAVDSEVEHTEDTEKFVSLKTVLVGESALEQIKAKFKRLTSCYVYSLSRVPIEDSLRICEPTIIVRQVDASSGEDLSQIVGRTVSKLVKGGDTKPPPVASSSKLVDPLPTSLPSTSQLKAKASRPMLKQEGGELKPLVPVEKPKPKATGKLDWGKAKLKEPKIEKQIKSESVKSSTNCSNMGDVNDPKAAGSKLDKDVVGDETKARDGDVNRGTKRKSDVSEHMLPLEESIAQSPPWTSNHSIRTKKGVVLSESEDSGTESNKKTRSRLPIHPMRKGRSQSVASDSDAEGSVRQMFDIDDSKVIKASNLSAVNNPPPQSDEDDAPLPTLSDPEHDFDTNNDPDSESESSKAILPSKPKPRRRKVKKDVPLGRNGLPKKRVTRSRMTTDAKGYMVTEDYSSFESDDEEQPTSVTMSKSKQTSKPASTSSSGDEDVQMNDLNRSENKVDSQTHPFRTRPLAKPKPQKTYTGKPSGGTMSTKGPAPSGNKASQSSLMNFFGKPKK